MLRTLTLAVLCVALMAAVSLAQEPNTMPDGKYHLAIAKTHNVHATDNALLLQKYAKKHKAVPDDVLKEHTAAMKFHVQAAQKSYARLATTAKTESDPKKQADLLKQIDTINARLAKINEMVKKMEAQSTAADEVAAQTALITKELVANRAAAQSVDNNFYNMESSDYYEDGLGHFAD